MAVEKCNRCGSEIEVFAGLCEPCRTKTHDASEETECLLLNEIMQFGRTPAMIKEHFEGKEYEQPARMLEGNLK